MVRIDFSQVLERIFQRQFDGIQTYCVSYLVASVFGSNDELTFLFGTEVIIRRIVLCLWFLGADSSTVGQLEIQLLRRDVRSVEDKHIDFPAYIVDVYQLNIGSIASVNSCFYIQCFILNAGHGKKR